MSRRGRVCCLVTVTLAVAICAPPVTAAPVSAPHVQVELVADTTTLAAGQDATLGVRFIPENGWHVYWRNPGDSGEAPSVNWTLPAGFQAGEIQWPAPERIPVGPLINFGYAGAVLLPVALDVPANLGGTNVVLRAHARWLVCNPEECIPGEMPLSLELAVGSAPAPSTSAPLFAAARQQLPSAPPTSWRLAARTDSENVLLLVDGFSDSLSQPPVFFPYSREAIEPSAAQEVEASRDGFALSLRRWPQSHATALEGVLRLGTRAYAIAVPIAVAGFNFQPLVLAFVGGLLLNLMPCVFPVLALKGLSLVSLAGEGRRRARVHGLLYWLGVIVSFWILAGALLALRAAGEQLGWGFQLQSPVVIAGLAALFFWMALILLGVSSVGASIMGVGNSLTTGDGYRSAFFTGVLATIVATPCTAPFMGAALGYALVQPAPVALAVFTSLAIGLAAPYVMLTFMPALMRLLPRPGAWMETLKQLMAFPLLATVVWLVWVASLQGGPAAVLATLSILLLLGFTAWMTSRSTTVVARMASALAVLAAVIVGATVAPSASGPVGASALVWEPYSPVRVEELVRQGKPVFVDFTAAWCVTCQVNKKLVLETEIVAAKMRAVGIATIRADWTRPDADISRALQQFGRDGVPLYVLYSGRANDPPRILPQILTTQIVITELEQLERGSRT